MNKENEGGGIDPNLECTWPEEFSSLAGGPDDLDLPADGDEEDGDESEGINGKGPGAPPLLAHARVPASAPAPARNPFSLNEGQATAINGMVDFLALDAADSAAASADPFFLLRGPAGTGKTYCIQELIQRSRKRFVFTAPTNKATKVLRETLRRDDYFPMCKTIYSLLGLRLEANGEIKELAKPEEEVDLAAFAAVVVDEASMINEMLFSFIDYTARTQGVKFIFMGDAAQLPPVGEASSRVWGLNRCAELTRVMRHDNQILKLATELRTKVDHPCPSIKLLSDNANGEGVWVKTGITQDVVLAAGAGELSGGKGTKIIAWRNATVDGYNKIARQIIFGAAASATWLPEDRIVITEPVKDLNEDRMIAHTDDEGVVEHVHEAPHPIYAEFTCWRLAIRLDENKALSLWLLHEKSAAAYQRRLGELSAAAKANGRYWRDFWAFKEAFNQARHAYAITAHRSQGSTYEKVIVDWRDILSNRNRGEAFRCLYVAATRPKKQLILG